ncbi:hypothetical protein EG68_00885 [Paragonimus skrjabini miyazakii]|uniref:Uncharacterized protein n=1 Tax=Paragonimus skrjabini miyazakii TaxID=59628 RepID=A0A8S9ZCN6_9TREM|nr:hypothetical protein EG68_00885 [Paragonimus skrjabini miyazakii]
MSTWNQSNHCIQQTLFKAPVHFYLPPCHSHLFLSCLLRTTSDKKNVHLNTVFFGPPGTAYTNNVIFHVFYVSYWDFSLYSLPSTLSYAATFPW